MIARGFIKTGLGRRIALQMIRLLGKRTLGLAYGLAVADLILSPAMPSNTARCVGGGGLFIRSLIHWHVVLTPIQKMNHAVKSELF